MHMTSEPGFFVILTLSRAVSSIAPGAETGISATCRDASAAAGTMSRVTDFYPGDEWVDWWGIKAYERSRARFSRERSGL